MHRSTGISTGNQPRRRQRPVDGATLVLQNNHGSASRARRFIAEHLTRHGLGDISDDAQLVGSELVTNALLHGGSPARLFITFYPSAVRLEVRDQSPVWPVRSLHSTDAMTGRGLHLVEGLARDWGVAALDSGKAVWAEIEAGGPTEAPEIDEQALIDMWAADEPDLPSADHEPLYMVTLGDVPTDLMVDAKAHVENLVREFTFAASGADSGLSAPIPADIADMIEGVVSRFAEARQMIKRQAVAAANAGQDHVRLQLELPASAADAGEEYLRALDQADAYCRAARLLTLESPPTHRVFRHWYVEELVQQLRHAAAGQPSGMTETFEQRLLNELATVTAANRKADRGARLHSLAVALAAAATPEAVAEAVLDEGVAALGASGGGLLVTAKHSRLAVTRTVGYDEAVVARLRSESRDAELPAASAMRTGEPVWLESHAERNRRFPALAGLEPGTVSMCAVPLESGGRRLGALRFSFAEARLFDEEERSFVEAMAAQTAQALDRARLFIERAEAAQWLRRSLHPPRLPEIPGAHASAVYLPRRSSTDIGGDFYDVWPCGENTWAVAVGDVCGTGPAAAAVAALVRHTLRALTLTSTDGEAILGHLDRSLADAAFDTPSERFCTVVLGFLQRHEQGWVFDVASGGHIGPVIVHADGTADAIELTGSLLGVLPDAVVDRRVLPLDAGDEIVLVTDGATEARRGGAFFDLEGVISVATAARAESVDIPRAIQEAVMEYAGGSLDDDLAVLALRVG